MQESHPIPWQFQWKRPQWQVVDDEGDPREDVEGTCLGMVSALITEEELPDDYYSNKSTENGGSVYTLSVTVVSSPFCVDTPGCGDLLVLEIVRQSGPTTTTVTGSVDDELEEEEKEEDEKEEVDQKLPKPSDDDDDAAKSERLLMKVLRWPGVALQADLQQKDDGEDDANSWRNNLPIWLGGTPQNRPSQRESTVGVVAACLCRRLVGEDDKRKAAALNALDTMTFLSLGMDPEVQANTTPKDSHNSSKGGGTVDPSDVSTPELLLACLCSDGRIHVYSPWKLLQLSETAKRRQIDDNDAFANSMSSFLLGDYVFEQLQSNIWPLSQPEATLKLTVPMPRPGQANKDSKKSTNNNEDMKNSTSKNDASAESTPSADKSDKEAEGAGISLWDRSVWDPQVDPFTAIYRTVDNVPTHCVSAFEYVAIAGQGRRVQTGPAKTKQQPTQGGFITLLSLQHLAEVRTLFLPFVPSTISPFAWGGMQFLFVIGDQGVAVAIRIDISVYNSVICGEAPSLASATQDPNEPIIPTVSSDQSLLSYQSTSSHNPERRQKPNMARCFVHRFQILPILLPETISDETEALSVAKATLFGSSPFCCPPGIVMVSHNSRRQVLVLQSKLEAVDYVRAASHSTINRLFRGYRRARTRKILAITTSHEPRHVARIRSSELEIEQAKSAKALAVQASTWCHLGQGWCLLGIASSVYFICWEGATSSEGPFVCELQRLNNAADKKGDVRGLHSYIMPVDPFTSDAAHSFSRNRTMGTDLQLPFAQGDALSPDSKLRRVMSGERKKAEMNASRRTGKESGMDSVVAEAIQSISLADYKRNIVGSSPPSSLKGDINHYSHREKSIRLLKKCPTWSQLEDTMQNRIRLEGQVPAVNVRLRNHIGKPYVLTLRHCADSGMGTPFHQILSWLSQNKDYFIAASVALDLKKDAATLKHLWRSFDRIDEDDERTKLEGLLDGIIPIHEQMINGNVDSDQLLQFTLMQLADMTIGCLCRGGFAMSSTLEFFLQQDAYYEGSRTCLVLAAIAAQAVADEDGTPASLMGTSYERPADQEQFVQDIMWPVRCLLQVGVTRKILPTALELINAAVPDELRRKRQHKQLDSMMLCAALVKLIIGSSPDATELLLDLVDEEERKRFWSSLDHGTQMELALVVIDNKCPLLRQLEVRSWALGFVQICLHDAATDGGRGREEVPTDWLKSLCSGCLVNANCDIKGLLTMRYGPEATGPTADGLAELVHELAVTREALIAGSGSGGLDFNLIIPALLLLQNYNQQWNDGTQVSTQSILNAACNLAGRVPVEEPLFAFDGTSLMKQCALAGNICAGANLVGGKNGLILECCWVLIECGAMSMEEAEAFLRDDHFNLYSSSSESEKIADDFVLGCGHKHVLWLLDQHVLQVKTYGEFDSTPSRGKVDPVYAARVCLRTWYVLTKAQLTASSAWLVGWLRGQLGIENDAVSRKRLACAALTQVLLWSPGRDNATVLAEQMKLESRFLVQLSQACWSLVEGVPPIIADKLLAQEAVDSTARKRLSKPAYIS